MVVDPYRNGLGAVVAEFALIPGADIPIALDLRREVEARVVAPALTNEVTVYDLSFSGRATMDVSVSKVQQRYWFTWIFNREECEALLRKLNHVRHNLDTHITYLQRENLHITGVASSKLKQKENALIAQTALTAIRAGERDVFERQLGDMTRERDRLRQEKGDVERALNGMTQERDQRQQERDRFQGERGALEIERNRLTERIAVLDARIPELERQLQRVQEEAAAAQRAMARLQEELAESQRSGRMLGERFSKLSEECTHRTQENEQLNQFARECKDRNKTLIHEMQELRAQQEVQLREMESEKNAQLSELRVKIAAVEKEADELKRANALLGSRVEILTPVAARVPDLEREKGELSGQVLVLKAENKTKDEQATTQIRVMLIALAVFAAVIYVMNTRFKSSHVF